MKMNQMRNDGIEDARIEVTCFVHISRNILLELKTFQNFMAAGEPSQLLPHPCIFGVRSDRHKPDLYRSPEKVLFGKLAKKFAITFWITRNTIDGC
jgi:hypothetical protein